MAYSKFHEKNYWESSKLTNSKISPSRENYAHFISCKPPHKNHPREYFGTTLCFIQISTSVVEKFQILSVAFHLAATVVPYFGSWQHKENHSFGSINLLTLKINLSMEIYVANYSAKLEGYWARAHMYRAEIMYMWLLSCDMWPNKYCPTCR